MRAQLLVACALLLGEAAAACAANNCLRAVQRIAAPSRNGTADCISYLRVTVTPATNTHYSTVISSSTSIRNVTATFNFTTTAHAVPSKRWQAQHDVLDYLHGTLPLEGRQVTASPTAMPKYASVCSAPGAYASACSCVGASRQTITAPTPTVTSFVTTHSVLYRNTTVSTRYFNSTATAYQNTSTVASDDATTPTLVPSTTATSGSSIMPNSTSLPLFSNSTTGGPYLNTTTRGHLQNTTSALSSTITAPPYHNTTTRPPFLNSTTSEHHLNTTTGRWLNTTSTGRWLNTSSTASTTRPTATKTIDKTCGETAQPFAVRVSQADGLFDGWYLRMSGNAVLFTRSANSSSQFSVEGSGRLCAVGRRTEYGNAAIAVVETHADSAGSMLYFVDGQAALNLTERGYGDLDCTVTGGPAGLRCAEGALSNWLGCGLQLEVSSRTGGEVDGMNCTAVQLAPVYGSSP